MLYTTTNEGVHDCVVERVVRRYADPGAMATRLRSLGCDVAAVDRDANGFEAAVPRASLGSSGEALLSDNHIFVVEAAS